MAFLPHTPPTAVAEFVGGLRRLYIHFIIRQNITLTGNKLSSQLSVQDVIKTMQKTIRSLQNDGEFHGHYKR